MLRVAPQLSIVETRFRLTISRTVFLLSPPIRGRSGDSCVPLRQGRAPAARGDQISAAVQAGGQGACRAPSAAIPERIRSWISSRSNSAMPASMVASIRPCGVARSNVIPFKATTDTRHASNSFSVASRSVVLRPHRESSVTSTASICRAWASAMTLRRSARSSRTPDPVSLKMPTTS